MLRVITNPIRKTFILKRIFAKAAVANARLWWLKSQNKLNKHTAVEVCQPWSRAALEKIGANIEVEGVKPLDEPCIMVGNHMSYLDIPLMWALTDAVFVSKDEVKNWPIIGSAATALGTIFVQRASRKSRAATSKSIAEAVTERKSRICIFPEGTSSVSGKKWNRGVFKIAKENNIKVQPFRIFYSPSRSAAFIDNDALLPHVWKLLDEKEGFKCSLKIFDAVEITDPQADCLRIQDMIQASVNEGLENERKKCKVEVITLQKESAPT